jgi:glyoxylase-like metal-dependent hydrolase (beta-lactamase superfamily II)
MKVLKWVAYLLLALIGLGTPAYWWLTLESHKPNGTYAIDITEVRRLAESLPGEKPQSVRVETPGTFDGYLPLIYDSYPAVAPGVVLIKAPGHTPGSQMIFVERSDGKDLLFLGDVAWRFRSIELKRERPRLITWLMNEDRDAVMRELIELDRLHNAEPELEMVPGHDDECLEHLEQTGLLVKGFL